MLYMCGDRPVDPFVAFDGSGRQFKRLGIFDLDCCYLGSFRPDDGYYIVEKASSACGCPSSGKCVVLESARYYAEPGRYPVGAVVDCPSTTPERGTPQSPIDSATKRSLGANSACCNADGSMVYAELFDEITNPLE